MLKISIKQTTPLFCSQVYAVSLLFCTLVEIILKAYTFLHRPEYLIFHAVRAGVKLKNLLTISSFSVLLRGQKYQNPPSDTKNRLTGTFCSSCLVRAELASLKQSSLRRQLTQKVPISFYAMLGSGGDPGHTASKDSQRISPKFLSLQFPNCGRLTFWTAKK